LWINNPFCPTFVPLWGVKNICKLLCSRQNEVVNEVHINPKKRERALVLEGSIERSRPED